MVVEDGAGMTEAAELIRSRHAGRPAADDGDPFAGHCAGFFELIIVGDGSIADELLYGVDADVIVHLVAVAAILAGRRAHATHLRGEGIRVGGAAERILRPAHALRRLLDTPRDLQPAADILTGRAAALAGRCAVHVGGTLVAVIRLEDLRFQIRPLEVTVVVLAEGMVLGLVGLAPRGRHY